MLQRILLPALLAPALLLTGCSWTRNALQGDKIDYKTEGQSAKGNSNTLEVPPDLTTPTRNDRYSVAGDGTGPKRVISAVNDGPANAKPAEAISTVLPSAAAQGMRIERAGTQRWLVVKGKPDQYWQTIKEFWQEAGFVISKEVPEAGVMETDWAENRAQIRKDFLGRFVGQLLDGVYSTPQRDLFRTRLEVNANGETEIYISHRGMEEIYRNEAREQTVWQPRPADPELEAEFLNRMMARLAGDQKAATTAAPDYKGPARGPDQAGLGKEGGYSVLKVNDSFDRAWRRVGLALDRVGFTVEDRDRSKGLFYVRYADPDVVGKDKKSEGWISKMTSWMNTDKVAPAEQYQIKVTGADPVTNVAVLSKAGTPEESQTSRRILGLLRDELK